MNVDPDKYGYSCGIWLSRISETPFILNEKPCILLKNLEFQWKNSNSTLKLRNITLFTL